MGRSLGLRGRDTAVLLCLVVALAGVPARAAAEPSGDGHELALLGGFNLFECTVVGQVGLGYAYDPNGWLALEVSATYLPTRNLCTDFGSLIGSQTVVASGAGARIRPFQIASGQPASAVGHALTIGLQAKMVWAITSPEPYDEGLQAALLDIAVGYEYRQNPFAARVTTGVWVAIDGDAWVIPMIQAAIGWAF